ncbi:glycosyltransferase family 2 protein [Spirosoma jeollabukense]
MHSPLVSIITVVYNAKSTLEDTIESVLGQKQDLFEYWIIDGGSTDGSIDIIQKYENQLAGWISEPDKGIYDAMNKGIDRAKGDWLYFLGADDLLVDGILNKITSQFKPSLKVVYGDVLYTTGGIMRSHIGVRCLLENRLHHQGAFYHKDLFDEFRYNQKFSVAADYELTLRIYLQKQPTLYIPSIISVFASGGYSTLGGSADVNAIRGIYLKNPLLNASLSVILNIYEPFMKMARRTVHKLKKNLI